MLGLSERVTEIIAGAILAAAVALGVWCAVLFHQRDRARNQADVIASALRAEQAAHAVTRQSVDELTNALNVKTAESDQRAATYAAVKAQDALNVTAADRARDADKSRMATLQALAKAAAQRRDCPVPSALAKQLEGL